MQEKLKDTWETIKHWAGMLSVQLAALVGLVSGVVTDNPELIVGLLGIIPVDPLQRLAMAVGVGLLVFLVPLVARMWPQGKTILLNKDEGQD